MNIWDNVEYFESLIADYAGSKYAVATDSCTNSIFLCLKYLKADGVVDVPKRTYISVPCSVIHAGCKIKFTDEPWSGVYKLNPHPVVDGAQRFTQGMYIKDTYHCISFHSKKILSIGRGGMILTDDKESVKWFKQARYDGRDGLMYNDIADINVVGWHMYMTPEQAIRGIEQFYKTPKINNDSGTDKSYKIDLSTLKGFKIYE